MASSAPELTARGRQLVAAARDLLEEGGPEALTMRTLAARVGIRAPSIYKHLRDKEELEAAVVADGLGEFADACEAAVDGAGDPLAAFGVAYRGFARAHPHLYRLINDRPLPRDRLPAGLEARAAAPLLAAVGGDPDRARATWAFAHGMVMLELTDRFPAGADLDAAWRVGLAGR
ncbi:MAG TPA: TetR/AcrR family transcriptional regulator [Miltoncostaeaceae bacterium]|jgi:AcrR family transcriptional regulator|nr:TetR/AcrR family transcriptional regulator [Miltoncostaeaceae bacterium]